VQTKNVKELKMTEKYYSIDISNYLWCHLDKYYSSDDPDPSKRFMAWGKCLANHSKQFLGLAAAIERENSDGAGIEIEFFVIEDETSISFLGAPDALMRIADEGLIKDITGVDEG
jgi:hypothetical protein